VPTLVSLSDAVHQVAELLKSREIILDYQI